MISLFLVCVCVPCVCVCVCLVCVITSLYIYRKIMKARLQKGVDCTIRGARSSRWCAVYSWWVIDTL